jgi:TRAP-type mannitol/chloroaromatic compound transport system permease large subunit
MFPGFFLAFLYLIYVIGWCIVNPKIAPRLPLEQMRAPISPWVAHISSSYSRFMLPAMLMALVAPGKALRAGVQGVNLKWWQILAALSRALAPVIVAVATLGAVWWYVTIYSQKDNEAAPVAVSQMAQKSGVSAPSVSGGVQEPPGASGGVQEPPGASSGGVQEPPGSTSGVKEPPAEGGLQAPPGSGDVKEPSANTSSTATDKDEPLKQMGEGEATNVAKTEPVPASFYTWFLVVCLVTLALLAYYYVKFDAEQYEIMSMLIHSVAPLGILTFVVLGVILFGITTATESAAVGAAGAFLMAWQAGTLNFQKIKEAVFLTAKTTSMVCWLFVGSALFSAVFAILGGQNLVESWVLGMNLTPIQFLLVSQAIIFVLGWPLEWTEIIVIFVPIFLPLLTHFQIDPLLWGVLVFVNLQAAFLSPPVAMSAFYLKGVSPAHVTINQIFAGMMPYMLIVILCMVLMYIWPGLTLWLPNYLYGGG